MKTATNAQLMKIKNEKLILSIINQKPVSRAELAVQTGLTKAAISIITDELINRGIVFEKEIKTSSVGRNPSMLYLNGDALYIPAVNITRKDITVGITNLLGSCIAEESFGICDPYTAFEKIRTLYRKLISENKIPTERIYKAAVVTPGPVNREKGIILNPPNFREWNNIAVADALSDAFDCEVIFENVSKAAALSEKYFGAAKGCDDFVSLQVDEGIGTAVVSGGRLFEGLCEFGHISIDYAGEKCECGNRGCLEKYASVPNVLKNSSYNSWREVMDGDCDDIIRREAEFLSVAIITANNIFNLESAVLCGEINYKSQKLVSYISDIIKGNMLMKKAFSVIFGEINSKSVTACAVAVNDFFTSPLGIGK